MNNEAYCEQLVKAAASASQQLRTLTGSQRDLALKGVASALRAHVPQLLEANAQDIEKAKAAGMAPYMVDRLTLTPARIEEMAKGV